jgi:hypothetical protein
VPHPAVLQGLAALFTINALYRVMRFEYVHATFAIAPAHIVLQIVVLLGLASSLLLLYRRAAADIGAQPLTQRRPAGA